MFNETFVTMAKSNLSKARFKLKKIKEIYISNRFN